MKRSLFVRGKNKKNISAVLFTMAAVWMLTACSYEGTIVSDANSAEAVKDENLDKAIENAKDNASSDDTSKELQCVGKMELSYAKQFEIDYYEEGYAYIRTGDEEEYVIIPEGYEDNNLGYENAGLIHKPVDSIYLAATSAMDLFREIDGLDNIKACSTKAEDYSIEEARERILSNAISFVGKYSAPDYEKLLLLNTGLAIESTMIYHSPKVKEELEKFHIPVLVERSSYEEEPLGRLEWVKLYGLLLDKEKEAGDFFDKEIEKVNAVTEDVSGLNDDNSRPKVVFFYISSNGYVNVRKPGDYISKMIETAGGEYALDSLKIEEENALSTINISWEDFYVYAKDADILIYNGTIDGGINKVEELTRKNDTINDFKAVADGKVYCTNNNMYQETSAMAEIIVDFNRIISGDELNSKYMRHVE